MLLRCVDSVLFLEITPRTLPYQQSHKAYGAQSVCINFQSGPIQKEIFPGFTLLFKCAMMPCFIWVQFYCTDMEICHVFIYMHAPFRCSCKLYSQISSSVEARELCLCSMRILCCEEIVKSVEGVRQEHYINEVVKTSWKIV